MKVDADRLHLFVLCSFAVAQPLFDLLSRNAGFFVAHGSHAVEIVFLALLLSVALPAVLVGTIRGVSRMAPKLETALRGLLVVVLVALIMMPALKRVERLSGRLGLGLAIATGLIFALSLPRVRSLRMFLTALTPAIVIFPCVFLLASPVRRLLYSPRVPLPAAPRVAVTAPVVMVVLDELPLTSLLDANGEIDAALFPNLAAFAQDATWFRNATTVSDTTLASLPTLVTGLFPEPAMVPDYSFQRLPTARDYPRSLFSLLGRSHTIRAIESQTALCPEELNTLLAGSVRSGNLGTLLFDVAVAYLHIVTPKSLSAGLPPISSAWSDFADPFTPQGRATGNRSPGTIFMDFVDTLDAGPGRPTLSFLHVLLPHVPWIYLPSGRRYADPSLTLTGVIDERWSEEPFLVAQGYQRHLLQLGFVDTLIGRLINRLKQKQAYEGSLIVITADHGTSFTAGGVRRGVSTANLADVASVPLLIKAPGQPTGRKDEREAQLVDVLPTIAGILGVELPWRVDGRSLWGGTPEQPRTKFIVSGQSGPRLEVAPDRLSNGMGHALRTKFLLFGSPGPSLDPYHLGPQSDLQGVLVDETDASESGSRIVVLEASELFSNVDPGAEFLPTRVRGRILGQHPSEKSLDLAIAVNGTVRATTRALPTETADLEFSAMVPEASLRRGRNNVGVFVIHPEGTRTRLTPARQQGTWWGSSSTLRRGPAGEVIESPSGRPIPIRSGLAGFVDSAEMGTYGLRLRGWAADIAGQRPVDTVAVFLDGRLVFSAPPTLDRTDAATQVPGADLDRAGFSFVLPPGRAGLDRSSELRLFALTRDGGAWELGYPAGYRFHRH